MQIKFWPVGENLLCKTFKSLCHLSSSWLPFKAASFMTPNYFGILCAFHLCRSHQKSFTGFLLREFSEKKMQMKFPPVRENLLCKIFNSICHLSSSWLPFKVASFMTPNYFRTLCTFHLCRSHQKSFTGFLLREFSEKKMQIKFPPVRENLLCKTFNSVCHLSSSWLPFKAASFMTPNYFGTFCAFHLGRSQKKCFTGFLLREFSEKKMQMKFSPIRENLLCKTFNSVCHLSSSWLPFKTASFMTPNYFRTLCAFHLCRSHQKSFSGFLLREFSEKKIQIKFQPVRQNLLCKPLYRVFPYR